MSDYVGLNVGGKIYRTSRLTVTRYPDSFFSTLLDGDIPSEQDDQGNYLIDQDGKIFRHVLNFLRYGELELPEGFNELGLLRRQADFFLLQPLKESIDNPSYGSIRLLFDDNKLFNTTKETLLKKESFFTKMLKGEVAVSRDPQGNYIMDRDGSLFSHIRNYLRDGGIFNAVTPDELDHLEDEAKHFGLYELGFHIDSIKQIRSQPRLIHLYASLHSPSKSVVYDSPARSPYSSDGVLPLIHNKKFKIIDDVVSRVVRMDIQPTSLQDLMDYAIKCLKKGQCRYDKCDHIFNDNSVRLQFEKR